MTTPTLSEPYAVLSILATGDFLNVNGEEAKEKALRVIQGPPPYLPRFFELYPNDTSLADSLGMWDGEKILRMLARGDFRPIPVVPGEYRHFKGAVYTVVGVATYAGGAYLGPIDAVVYWGPTPESMYVRPLSEWYEIVEWPDGEYRPRFMREESHD